MCGSPVLILPGPVPVPVVLQREGEAGFWREGAEQMEELISGEEMKGLGFSGSWEHMGMPHPSVQAVL